VLYGPPGAGKTTLVEAVAKSAGVPLVEITPSDILVGGEEAIERRTRHVFLALSMLTHVVILFDEFDPILQNRGKRKGDEPAKSIFEFLTPGMLPKLKLLHDSAKQTVPATCSPLISSTISMPQPSDKVVSTPCTVSIRLTQYLA
jgi:SpoVK/Ycf46/Vps4 family AAA+-type ATPase